MSEVTRTGLQNKVILVTGGNYGSGAATAQASVEQSIRDIISEQARWVTGQLLHVSGGHPRH